MRDAEHALENLKQERNLLRQVKALIIYAPIKNRLIFITLEAKKL
jgi:hypothetical protein